MSSLFRQLPAVDALLADPRLRELPRGLTVRSARRVLDDLRGDIRDGRISALPDVAERVGVAVVELLAGRLRPVLNATGVVVHTNLGRAPWAPEAIEAAAAVARGYCNLELDLASGRRGGRLAGVEALMADLTGAEATLVVNNCAAAVLLALTALARGREVVVSRGELVEIGGSFRVPEVIASGGARLVEVGTTNRTRLSDYAAAIGPEAALLLKVHTANFQIVGFTEAVDRAALVGLARERGLLVVEDLGSGSLAGALGEPSVRDAVAAGVDLAVFSGDKLLGGPQAGLIVGRREVVGALRRHPLYRALRVDKVTLAALEATLALHAGGGSVPVDRMLDASPAELAARADRLVAALAERGVLGLRRSDDGAVGGGAAPCEALRSEVVDVAVQNPDAAARRLRTGTPAVVARLVADHLRLDVRTLADADLPVVAGRVAHAVGSEGDHR